MDGTRSRLVSALPDAVLALTAPDGSVGSGFFVAPGLVVTCAHVVRPGDWVAGRCGSRDLSLFADPQWYRPKGSGNGPDLALLTVPEGFEHPAVCLASDIVPGDELWGFGHPQGSYRAGESVSFRAEGPSSRSAAGDVSSGTVTLHHVAQGRAGPGFSGAPVLSWRTGGVCGVLRLAYGLQKGMPGARLVPVNDIWAAFPFLDKPELVTGYRQPWLSLLDDNQLRQGGWRYAGPALRDYLRAARALADDLPYSVRLPGVSPPPLTNVYVNQHVTAAHGGQEAALPAAAVVQRDDSALIIGGPGAGKSSLARHLTAELAEQWLGSEDPPDVVPVYVTAAALVGGGSVAERLASAMQSNPRFSLRRSLPADFFGAPALAGTPWLVLVDGLDEVLDQQLRRALLAMVTALWSTPERSHRLLVLTRPLPDQDLTELRRLNAAVYEIQPLAEETLPVFAARWFVQLGEASPDSRADQFIAALARSEAGHLAHIPLLATMLILLYAEDPQSGLPHSRSELYERFVQYLLDTMFRRPTPALLQLQQRVEGRGAGARASVNRLVEEVRGLLESIALQRHNRSQDAIVDLAEAHTTELRPHHFDRGEWRDILRELLSSSGLMTESGSDLAFLHHTLQEFLAAFALARSAPPTTRAAAAAMARELSPLDWRSSTLHGQPYDQSFLRFLFAAWARQGQDTRRLVRGLFNPPWTSPSDDVSDRLARRGRRLLRWLRLMGPSIGAGLVALFLADGDVLSASTRSLALRRLRRIALRDGRSWAAEAIAVHDRAEGLKLLEAITFDRNQALHRRLAAAEALARQGSVRAIPLLTSFVLDGPMLSRHVVRWRQVHGNEAFIYPVVADPLTAVGSRIAAAHVLATVSLPAAQEALGTLVGDLSQPAWHRLRYKLAQAQLDPTGTSAQQTPLHAAMSLHTLNPQPVLALAKSECGDPASALTAWARDATATGAERIVAALALIHLDRQHGTQLLAWLAHKPKFFGWSRWPVDGLLETVWMCPSTWRHPWSRRISLLWDEDVAAAAEHLSEFDKRLAIEALNSRSDPYGPVRPRTLELHARLDPTVARTQVGLIRLRTLGFSGAGLANRVSDLAKFDRQPPRNSSRGW
ncbi:trypsin-like peptidase domain-containing protein [Streptomyces sp. SD15]